MYDATQQECEKSRGQMMSDLEGFNYIHHILRLNMVVKSLIFITMVAFMGLT